MQGSLMRRFTTESSSSESTDSESELNVGTTRIIHGGNIVTLSGSAANEHTSAVISTPGLQNIQIGSGYCTIVGTSGNKNIGRRHQTKRGRHSSKPTVPKLSESKSAPTHEDLTYVCNNVGKHWRKLAYGLGLSRGAVEGIEIDFRTEGHYEMAWQALLKWRRQNGTRARICDVIRVLDDIGLTELASELPIPD